MCLIFLTLFVAVIFVAVYYMKAFEELKEEYENLEYINEVLKQDNEKLGTNLHTAIARARKEGRQEAGKRVYTALYQEQDYNSVKNLQNKLKSILDELLAD